LKRFLAFVVLLCAFDCAAQDFYVASSLREHVFRLCDPSLGGRKAGSAGERAAAEYLYDYMKRNGVLMTTGKEGQEFLIADKDTISSLNIVGIVEGSDPELKKEYIVVGANMDNLGSNPVKVNGVPVMQIYPGADANASGMAMLLELSKLVVRHNYMFPRSIIFAGFGAAENGFAGSWFFANHSFEEVGSIKAMVNLHMLGRGRDNRFSVFSQIPMKDMMEILDDTRQEPVVIFPAEAPREIVPSDHLPFYQKNIPVFCFTTGKTAEYRTLKDTPEMLSYEDMELECNYLFYFLKTLSSRGKVPEAPAIEIKKIDEKVGGDHVYTPGELDSRPQFFRSDEKRFLEEWVYKYLKYPRAALANGIQGKVLVTFIVEKNGQVSNVEILSGIDDDLDAEALRVISVSPKWTAGKLNGEKVRCRITIPVEFRLTTSSPSFKIKR